MLPEIQRLPGIGQAQLFGTERAMRIWIDPAKLAGFNLSAADVNNAIRAQNAQVSSGSIGELPNITGQSISATVVVDGLLNNTTQFGNILLRANADGRLGVRLGRGPHRTRCANLCNVGPPERQPGCRHWRPTFANWQRHRRG